MSDSPTPEDEEKVVIVVGGRKAWVFRRRARGNFSVKGNVNGTQFLRSTGFSTKGMAVDAAKRLWKARLENRLDALDETKLKKVATVATIGELVQAHALAGKQGRLEVNEETARTYRACLRRVVAWARGLHSLPAGGKREKIEVGAVDKLSGKVLTAELVDEFARHYVAVGKADHLLRDQRLRGAHSNLRNARAMLEGSASRIYKGMVLPELKEFLEVQLKGAEEVEHEELTDAVVQEIATAAAGLKEAEPALYLVHLCFRHFGMRNDEIENARLEWIERLKEPRVIHLPDGSKREAVALMRICRRSYWVPKASAGDVGIAADVLAEIDAVMAAMGEDQWKMEDGKESPYLIPAATATDRWELIYRRHSDFVRPWTGDRQKTSYELRRWGATKIAELHQSGEMADWFLRHAKKTTAEKHYLTKRPLPAPITLADCGL